MPRPAIDVQAIDLEINWWVANFPDSNLPREELLWHVALANDLDDRNVNFEVIFFAVSQLIQRATR
jgi:hypothetical protein